MKPVLLRSLLVLSACGLALGLVLYLLIWTVGLAQSPQPPANGGQEGVIRYVALGGEDEGDCSDPGSPCASVQYAVDQANAGDEVRIAGGTYTHVWHRPPPPGYAGEVSVITQCVYLSKTLTLRGGYTPQPPADGGQGGWTVSDPAANPTVLDAQDAGRVLFIAGEVSPTIEGLTLTNGYAWGLGGESEYCPPGDGGGIYVVTATVTLRNNTISDNWAVGGGGIYLLNSPSQVLNNTISGNSAGAHRCGGWGGGIWLVSSPATLSGNLIQNNEAVEGSGGGIYVVKSAAVLSDNTILGNSAGYLGGGVCLKESDATLLRNRITGNQANQSFSITGGGGGVALWGSDATLSGNLIANNRTGWARGYGGGLYLWDSNATFVNNVILANWALNVGGISIQGGHPHFLHTTLAQNSSEDDKGIEIVSFGHLVMTNTIIANHSVGIYVTEGNTATLNGVLWFGNGSDIEGEGSIAVSYAYRGDPAFAEDGYHLTEKSAAIDRGLGSEVSTDLDGLPRLVGLAPDLGACEYPVALPSGYFVPLVRREHGLWSVGVAAPMESLP